MDMNNYSSLLPFSKMDIIIKIMDNLEVKLIKILKKEMKKTIYSDLSLQCIHFDQKKYEEKAQIYLLISNPEEEYPLYNIIKNSCKYHIKTTIKKTISQITSSGPFEKLSQSTDIPIIDKIRNICLIFCNIMVSHHSIARFHEEKQKNSQGKLSNFHNELKKFIIDDRNELWLKMSKSLSKLLNLSANSIMELPSNEIVELFSSCCKLIQIGEDFSTAKSEM